MCSKQLTQERCQSQFGDCYFDITGSELGSGIKRFTSRDCPRTVMNNTSIAAAVLLPSVPSGAPHPATMRAGAAAQGKSDTVTAASSLYHTESVHRLPAAVKWLFFRPALGG